MNWKQKFEEYIKAQQTLETETRILYTNVVITKEIAFWRPGMTFTYVTVNKELTPPQVLFQKEHCLEIEFPEEKKED